MAKKHRLLACLLCAVLLTGCGRGPSDEPGGAAPNASASDPFIPDVSEDIPDHSAIPFELPQGDVLENTVVEYTWDHPVTVDNGRRLTLRLHCEAEYRDNFWYYGVKSMELLEGETCLQTMSVLLADAAARGQRGDDPEGAYARTECWNEDGDLILEDLNFDSIPDLRLLKTTGVVNSVYLCWLWDTDFQKFRFAFSLWGYDVEVDLEKKQIITTARDAQTHITNYYEYGADSALHLVDTESVIPGIGIG